jgi:hypothetical protein
VRSSIIIFFILFSLIKASAQTNVELYFYDACKDSVVSLEFQLYSYSEAWSDLKSEGSRLIVQNKGQYFVSSSILRGEWYSSFSIPIDISDSSILDTLEIPNITMAKTGALHSSEFTYLNCSKISDGYEEDYRKDGTLRMTGEFLDGVPSLISEYNSSGVLKEKRFYSENGSDYNRVEYYNDNGILWFYEIHMNRKRKTIVKTYDEMGKLEGRQVIKHGIVKY